MFHQGASAAFWLFIGLGVLHVLIRPRTDGADAFSAGGRQAAAANRRRQRARTGQGFDRQGRPTFPRLLRNNRCRRRRDPE
jgi:hypothetical protein